MSRLRGRLCQLQNHVAVAFARAAPRAEAGDPLFATGGAPFSLAIGCRTANSMLGECGAAVVGVELLVPTGAAEALPIDASLANAPEALIEDVQWKRAARKPPPPQST